jgi:hypothetical protein
MSDRRLKTRGVVAIATAIVTLGIAAPLATADPAPRFIPQTQQAPPNSLRQNAPHLGEGLTGADRSWLTHSPSEPHIAVASSGFNWGDAGIGAGAAAAVLLVAAGSAVVIRRRLSPAH